MSEWLKETGCKPVGYAYAGSNPAPPIAQTQRGRTQPASIQAALRSGAAAERSGSTATCGASSFALRLGTATAKPSAAASAIAHIRNESVKPAEVGMPAAPRQGEARRGRQRDRAHQERGGEAGGGREAGGAPRPRQQRRSDLAAERAAQRPRDGVHPGGHAGLFLAHVLHDQVRHRREGK